MRWCRVEPPSRAGAQFSLPWPHCAAAPDWPSTTSRCAAARLRNTTQGNSRVPVAKPWAPLRRQQPREADRQPTDSRDWNPPSLPPSRPPYCSPTDPRDNNADRDRDHQDCEDPAHAAPDLQQLCVRNVQLRNDPFLLVHQLLVKLQHPRLFLGCGHPGKPVELPQTVLADRPVFDGPMCELFRNGSSVNRLVSVGGWPSLRRYSPALRRAPETK